MRTILIADEDADTVELISLVFSDSNMYRVVAVSSGKKAVLKAKEMSPDIVFADISLPDKDGYEVSKEIKDDPLLKNTIVVLLTVSLGLLNETKAAEAGADDFIIKPFGSEELAKRLGIGKEEPFEIRIGQITRPLKAISLGRVIQRFYYAYNNLYKYTLYKGIHTRSLIGQYGKGRVKFAGMIIVPLIVLVIAIAILYQDLTEFKSKFTQPSNTLTSEVNVNLHGVESKPMPIVKRKEKVVLTINDKREVFIENRKNSLSEQICVKDVGLVTEPASVFGSGRPGDRGIHSEGIKASRIEKTGILKEIGVGELGRYEYLGVNKQGTKEKDKGLAMPRRKESAKYIAVLPTINLGGKYAIQVGAFQKEAWAKRIADSLKSKGYPAFVDISESLGQGTWHRVRIGTFKTRRDAKLYGDTLKSREPLVKKVVIVIEEEKPEKKEGETRESVGYLDRIKIISWSIYVAWCVPTIHHITIENTNDIAYKDIRVRIRYYSASYSNAGTTRVGELEGILHITLPPYSKKTYLEKGVTLEPASACGMYVGSRDMEVLGAIPVGYSYNSEG